MAGRLLAIGQLHNLNSLKKRAGSFSRRRSRSSPSSTPGDGGSKLVQPPVEASDDGLLPGTPERLSTDPSQSGRAIPQPPRQKLSLLAREIDGSNGSSNESKRGLLSPTASSSDGVVSDLAQRNFALGACRMVVTVFCFLAGSGLLLMRTAPVSRYVVRQALYDRLVVRNTTTGFHTEQDFQVLEGSYKSWYFFNVSFDWNEGFRGSPNFSTLGPYTMKQYIKTVDVKFVDDVAYKSTAIYGKFLPEQSCSTCNLDDKITILNEMYMQMLAFHHFDELQVLRQFVPEVITRYVIETAAYFVQRNMSSPGLPARDLALQQFGDCSPLNGGSIRDAPNSTFFSKAFAPEFCTWSQNWTRKVNSAVYMTLTQSTQFLYGSPLGLLSQKTGFELAVQKIIQTCNPSAGVLVELPGFTFEMSVAIIEYLDYVAQGLGKEIFEGRAKRRYHGLFMTRTVREVLYGYHDPWLKYKFGDNITNSSTYVTQIYNIDDIDKGLSNISTLNAYTGTNTGEYNMSKLYWINQQAVLSDAPLNTYRTVSLNARRIQWQYGEVEVDSPSGAVFGRLQPEGNLTMWLSPWLRHVTLEYIGTGSQHGLKTYKYRMADTSLAACPDSILEKVDAEGPCIYPNQIRGITDMTLFQGGSMESFPMFYRADPRAIQTWGAESLEQSQFIPDDFEFRMDVEPSFGVTVNVSFWIQKLYWVRPSPLIYPLMNVGDGILFPISYYHIQTEANETVCKALTAGGWSSSATAFILMTVLPLVGVSCILCGVHMIWRKRMLKFCFWICIEGYVEHEKPQEMVTAEVTAQSRQFMEHDNKVQASQAAELRWRRFSEQLGEHDSHYLEMKKHYESRPIPVRPKHMTKGHAGDRQSVLADVARLEVKVKHFEAEENDVATFRQNVFTNLGKDARLEITEKTSQAEEYSAATIHDMPSTSLSEARDNKAFQFPPHRRHGSRSLSLVEVENAGVATPVRTKAARFYSLEEGEEEKEVRSVHRARASSSRARSFVVVEEGRTLIDMLKARKSGLATVGSGPSMALITKPIHELEPTLEEGEPATRGQ